MLSLLSYCYRCFRTIVLVVVLLSCNCHVIVTHTSCYLSVHEVSIRCLRSTSIALVAASESLDIECMMLGLIQAIDHG